VVESNMVVPIPPNEPHIFPEHRFIINEGNHRGSP